MATTRERWYQGYCREIAESVNLLAQNMPGDYQFTPRDVEHVLVVAEQKQHRLGLVVAKHSAVYLTVRIPKFLRRKK